MIRAMMGSALGACVLFAGCQGGPKVGEAAPSFEATTSDGQLVDLASYEGKVTVLDFWATWCGRCVVATPYVQRLHEQYADDPRVAIVGVHKDTDYRKGEPAAYWAEKGYTFDMIPDGRAVAEAYGVAGLPHFVVIDGDGEVIHRQNGFGEDDIAAFGAIIDGALESAEG
ncbi:MAG: TlpA disulfide reductase family protein [Planctomycetota bacterium]